jgi:hypothetical protein
VPDRERYVRDVCADEPGIADEVLALLAHADSADGFLERPAARPSLPASAWALRSTRAHRDRRYGRGVPRYRPPARDVALKRYRRSADATP